MSVPPILYGAYLLRAAVLCDEINSDVERNIIYQGDYVVIYSGYKDFLKKKMVG